MSCSTIVVIAVAIVLVLLLLLCHFDHISVRERSERKFRKWLKQQDREQDASLDNE